MTTKKMHSHFMLKVWNIRFFLICVPFYQICSLLMNHSRFINRYNNKRWTDGFGKKIISFLSKLND